MKHISDWLSELSVDVEMLEESAKAAAEKNLRQLEARRTALVEKIGVMAEELAAAKPEAQFSIQRWWTDAKSSLDDVLASDTRADFEVRGPGKAKGRMERSAEEAEIAAEGAISLAAYCLNVAEWAVLGAALARAGAEDKSEVV